MQSGLPPGETAHAPKRLRSSHATPAAPRHRDSRLLHACKAATQRAQWRFVCAFPPLQGRWPNVERWFEAMEARPAYAGFKSDHYTHVHDLPPQLGGCVAGAGPQGLHSWR